MKKKLTSPTKPLTGQALLEQIKNLEAFTREEKARRCGYSSLNADGSERLHMVKFMNALLEAEGIDVDGQGSSSRKSKQGRNMSFRVSVQANGNILIGSTYTKLMSLEPGDQFEVSLGRKHIHLNQVAFDDDQLQD